MKIIKFLTQNINVGGNIQLVRKSKEMKQSILAKKLGISSVAVSNIENNKSDITITRLVQIAVILDVKAELLLCENLIINFRSS